MKAKYLFVAAAAVTLMAACSENDALSVQNPAQQQGETPVSFETYMGRATTRAGAVGEIVTKEELQVNSFGVFAYYSNGAKYTLGTSKPDFMWNQKVEFDGDNWFYSPVKYWPNETADQHAGVDTADPTKNNATAEGDLSPDVVSFFAYAPYVDASTAGAVTPNGDGITSIVTLNTVKDDPKLTYTTPSDPLKTVDLLWGVVPAYKTKYSTVLGEQDLAATGLPGAGFPNYNLIKQKEDERIMFQFKHALAKLTIDVKGFFDDVPEHGAHSTTDPGNAGDASDQSANNVAKDTKIVVEYVKLYTEKYAISDELNLNNTEKDKPNWKGNSYEDGKQINFTISGSQLANLIRYRTPSAASRGYDEQPRGVTNEAVALLANDASQEAFFGIIPKVVSDRTTANWTVEVKYHVFTKDANLENGYSEITNVIKKENITMTLDPGKHYTLQLRLGMTSVKFDATVEDWVDGTTTPADLPINVAVEKVTEGTFTATPLSPTEPTYSGYVAKTGSFNNGTLTALELGNAAYTLAVSSVKAKLENKAATEAVASEATTINTDVEWIKPVWNGTTWALTVLENRTETGRTGHIWATYGGVDSEKIEVKQNGSTIDLKIQFTGDPYKERTISWFDMSERAYTVTAKYFDKDMGGGSDSGYYIDYSIDANTNGTFNHANWVKVKKNANAATGIIQATSKNEDEVNERTTVITISYDGKTSKVDNSITLHQSDK